MSTMPTATLPEMLRCSASGPNGIVYVKPGGSDDFQTYAALYAKALCILGHLQRQGAAPGDEVVFQLTSPREFIETLWACFLGRLVPVPLSLGINDEHRLKIYNVWTTLNRPFLFVDSESTISRLEAFGDAKGRKSTFEAMRRRTTFFADADAETQPGAEQAVRPDDIALIQFSSGSTGSPKGVPVRHESSVINSRDMLEALKATASDSYLSWLPLTHDFGIFGCHITPVVGGLQQHQIALANFTRNPTLWFEKVNQYRPSILASPNFGYVLFLDRFEREQAKGWDLSCVRVIQNGAEPISPEVCHRFLDEMEGYGMPRTAMQIGYGLAEATLCVSFIPIEESVPTLLLDRRTLAPGTQVTTLSDANDPNATPFVDIGYPLSHFEVRISDGAGAVRPDWVLGYIEVRGPSVMHGYYNAPELTRQVLSSDGWLNTGDLGFMHEGRLVITGRAKELIIAGGINYYPHDVERVVGTPEGLGPKDIAVCSFHDPQEGRERVIAFVRHVSNRKNFAALARRIRQHAMQQLGLTLETIIPLKQLPKTTSGKVQRVALVKRFQEGEFDAALVELRAMEAAEEARERQAFLEAADDRGASALLPLIRAEAERIAGAAITDEEAPLLDYGFDSRRSVELQSRLSQLCGIELPVSFVFDHPSLRKLSLALKLRLSSTGEGAVGAFSAARADHGPIAIVGVGCRLPGGCRTPADFFRLLQTGGDVSSEIPSSRFRVDDLFSTDPKAPGKAYTRRGYFVDDVDAFDAGFFGILPHEAEPLDPQQRLLLEVSWEALEHAGIAPEALRETPTGVFVGISGNDYASSWVKAPETLTPYSLTGTIHSTAAGRISYSFGFHGPTLAIDTACSSSLAALHLAVQSLRQGECEVALAAGVNLILSPAPYVGLSRLQALSPDGRCKTFDDAADGYGRGEGCGVVVLKRLSDAIRDGDRIVAVVRGTALNHDGRSNGLTVPNGVAQEQVIRAALRDGGVEPASVSYLEAHGTGTPLGDPQEIHAAANVYGAQRPADAPLVVASVKTNIGHLESAAGIVGLIKVALCLEQGRIPAHLHMSTPSRRIPWKTMPVVVPTREIAWPSGPTPRRGAISSFGLSGTNAHVILEEFSRPEPEPAVERPVHILPISARDAVALKELVTHYAALLSNGGPLLADLCYTVATGRAQFPERVAAIGATSEEMRAELLAILSGLARGTAPAATGGTARPAAWVFTGQGSQYLGMGRELYETSSVFREAMDECANALREMTAISLLDVLYGAQADAAAVDETIHAQPAIFAVEYALARLLASFGLAPGLVAGHSIGEIAAACVAGVFSLADALTLVATRGRLMQALSERGSMVALLTDEQTALRAIAAYPDTVTLAAINGPDSTVISGKTEDVAAVARALSEQGIRTRDLAVSHAFHSPLMRPVLKDFERVASSISYRAPAVPFFSSVEGRPLAAGEIPGASYWCRQVLAPVRFHDVLRAIHAEGTKVVVEVGPAPILTGLGVRAFPDGDTLRLSSLQQGASDWRQLLASLAKMYEAGLKIDWKGFDKPYRRNVVDAVHYPFQRARYWISPVPRAAAPAALPQAPSSPAEPASPPAARVTRAPKPSGDWRGQVLAEVRGIVANLVGTQPEALDSDRNLFDMGLDSLVLLRVGQAIERRFRISIPMTAFYKDVTTLSAIAELVVAQVPPEEGPEDFVVELGTEPGLSVPSAAPVAPAAPASHAEPGGAQPGGALERIVQEQLRIMSEQLSLLRGGARQETVLAPQPTTAAAQRAPALPAPSAPPAQPVAAAAPAVRAPAAAGGTFVPYRQIRTVAEQASGARQAAFVEMLVRELNARTPGSKRITESSRPCVANNRFVAGFRPNWKEFIYPLHVERAEGSRIWDVDGNDYIDISMGFGVYLLGHQVPYVMDPVIEQLRRGAVLGPMTPLPSDVAKLIVEATGVERVAFYNTGTEAIMVALRLARTVTGRTKVVLFAGSYHGSFDGVLAVPGIDGPLAGGVPMAPGTTPGMVQDVIVLPYNDPASLDAVRRCAGELAAVLVEPVQSRRPDIQPTEFLRELRQITAAAGAALIFDEVITGFRIGLGGAQAHFGVRADLATYGKIVGGGLPIGIVAGARRFMDSVDGGEWKFGDDSYPRVRNTFVAGTFCHHPMALAAANAVLGHLVHEGAPLYDALNRRTSEFARDLNEHFERVGAPLRVVNFGSLFRFQLQGDWELLFYRLMCKGVYVWEGRNCFFSTAHTDADIQRVATAVKEAVDEMLAYSFPSAPTKATAAAVRTFPMSAAQRRMYTLAQLEGGERAYHLHGALELNGVVDVERLEGCFRQLFERHEGLRTGFEVQEDGRFIQRIYPKVEFALERGAGQNADELIRGFIRSFALATPPLIRVALFKLSDSRHLLVIDAHHIAVDGISLTVLFQELVALYRGDKLAPVPRQCADHAMWEQEFLSSEAAAVQERYWRERLSGEVPRLELTLDFPRPLLRQFDGTTLLITYPSRRLRKRARDRGASLYMVLLAAYHLLLQSLAGQREIVVGTAHASRERGGFGATVGMFVNSLPVRVNASAFATFTQLLDEVKQRCLEAYEHQELPFDVLVERLGVGGSRSHNPLFDTMFSFEQADERVIQLPGLEIEEYPIHRESAIFDFALDVVEEQGMLNLRFESCAALFRRETIERHARHYLAILHAIEEEPERSLGEVAVLPREDRDLLDRFCSGARLPVAHPTVVAMFDEQVRSAPDATALVIGERPITYKALDERANGLAAFLHEQRKVGPETIVGIVTDRAEWTIIGILGVLKSGAAYMLLDPDNPPERTEHVLRDSGAALVLVPERHARHPALAAAAEAVRIETVASPHPQVDYPLDRESLAYVLYTSGSSGRPKGVGITHANLAHYVAWANSYYFPTPGSGNFGLYTSYSFDMTITPIFCPITRGRTLVILGDDVPLAEALRRGFEPGSLVDSVKLTPSHLAIVKDLGLSSTGVQIAVIGGEAFTPEQAAVLHGLNPAMGVYNEYGPTETTVGCTIERVEPGATRVTIGRPIARTSIHILDADGHLAPPFVAGELCVGGAGVGRGYVNDAVQTAAKFVRSPVDANERIYRTGDKARWLPDGTLEYLGRIDEQVKIRGHRIELGEIEAILCRHPGIRQAAAVVHTSSDGAKELVAYIVCDDGVTASEARAWVSRSAPAYMVPTRCYAIDHIPLAASGKADKKALQPPAEAEVVPLDTEASAPRGEVEALIAKNVAELTGAARVSMEHSLFDIGGDSITAIQLAARLQRHELSVAVKDVMRSTSLRELASYVVRKRASSAEEQMVGDTPLAPMQARFFARRPADPQHFNQALMLFRRARFEEVAVRAALGALLEHHDALRTTFREVGGALVQVHHPAKHGALYPLAVHDLRSTADAPARMEALASSLQSSLRLDAAPLLGAALFRMADGDRLLVVIHHLVVDGVSWRILLEDFSAAYDAIASGQRAVFPGKSASFQAWTRRLHELAGAGALSSQGAYWRDVEARAAAVRPLPRREAARSNTVRDAATLEVSLEGEQTRALLTRACDAYRTNVNELMLAALAVAVSGWTDDRAVAVTVEGHGRDELTEHLDTSRTVGWFTAMFPVVLDASERDELSRLIPRTKETLRRVPTGGVGYGVLRYLGVAGAGGAAERPVEPEITFNYLGSFEADFAKSLFTASLDGVGPTISPAAERARGLEINAMIAAGRATIAVEYNRHEFDEAAIQTFATSLRDALTRIVEHCVSRDPSPLTPSELDYRGFADLEEYARFLSSSGIAPADVRAVRALSPMQEGMMFEALRDETGMSHCEQIVLTVDGDLEVEPLSRAAEQLAQRYESMRTRFFMAGATPVQVVLGRATFPFLVEDIQALSPADQETRLATIYKEDRERGFDLTGPLSRITAVRRGPQTSSLVWTTHHIIIDGWCLGILVSELLQLYNAERRGTPLKLDAPPSYGAYIRWLERQDLQSSLSYWADFLKGYERPVALPASAKQGAVGKRVQASFIEQLDPELSSQLRRSALTCRATLSTLMQTLWGVLLSHYTSANDLVFGLVVSGRPAEIPGIERMVGLFINTVPVRIKLVGGSTVAAEVRSQQELFITSQQHQHCSLANIQHLTPHKNHLITHALVFENYPLDRVLIERAEREAELSLSKVDYFAHDTYDFLLTITATDSIELLFSYNAQVYDEQTIRAIASYYKQLLSLAEPEKTVDEIREAASAKIRAQSSKKHGAALAKLMQGNRSA